MAIFALYRYTLERINDSSRLPFENDTMTNDTPMDKVFESLFGKRGGTLDLIEEKEKKTRSKDTERLKIPHRSEILEHGEHMVAFRVQVNKSKNFDTEDWGNKTEGHYPQKMVLMDYRPDHRIIAIEKTSESDTDTVYELLRLNFERKMSHYDIGFTCFPLVKRQEFWEAVNEIRKVFNDVVKQVRFDFVGKKTEGKTFTDKMLKFINLVDANAHICFDMNDDKKLKRVTEDLARMAELCKENSNYALTVAFRDFGLYRYGQDIKAQWGFEDDLIKEYTCTSKQMDLFEDVENKVKSWFDHVSILFKDYIPENDEKPLCMEDYVTCEDEGKKVKTVKYLLRQVSHNKKPKDIIRPLRAAMDAGCIRKPIREVFEHECKVTISPGSWKRYMGGTVNPYENDRFYNSFLKEFGKMLA